MIVKAGPVDHETTLGVLRLDRTYDASQVALLVHALDRARLDPRDVVEADLHEGEVTFTLVSRVPGMHVVWTPDPHTW